MVTVQALADELKGSHRGYFLPLRPDKQHSPLEQQAADSGFVVERARELEHWLCALQAHPVVGASQVGPASCLKMALGLHMR